MDARKILGIVIIVGAVALFGISQYIKGQVGEGKEKIANAQKMIDRGDSILGLTPATKELGQSLTGGAKKKIANAQETVVYYENLAEKLQMGGFALLIVGGLVFFLVSKKKRR
jgi:hypothetical protein